MLIFNQKPRGESIVHVDDEIANGLRRDSLRNSKRNRGSGKRLHGLGKKERGVGLREQIFAKGRIGAVVDGIGSNDKRALGFANALNQSGEQVELTRKNSAVCVEYEEFTYDN